LSTKSLREHYKLILKPYFTKLLDKAIGQEDRENIQQLLKKPWNPYIFRHTVATEFLGQGRLTRDLGNQWFGWSEKSNMASIYENFDGHEAAQVLAESFGIVPQTKQVLPRLVECPNVTCKELNNPDAPFCVKCRIPLSVSGHVEREQEFKALKERMAQMQQDFESYDRKVKDVVDKFKDYDERQKGEIRFYKNQFEAYMEEFGPRHLTKSERQRVEGFLEQLKNSPDSKDYYDED
jgi:hypothetical protein